MAADSSTAGVLAADSSSRDTQEACMPSSSSCTCQCHAQDTDGPLQQELAALREQLDRKQQEVSVLQAQVERLSSFLDASNHEAALTSSSDSTSTQLQQQLDAALTELQHTRGLLDQLMQESSAAIKAACDQRFGALKLLLAEKVQELQECEQQRAAAQQLAEAKAEDCEAMRIALAAANTHIMALTAQQQQQQLQQQQQQPPQHSLAHAANPLSQQLAQDAQRTPSCSTGKQQEPSCSSQAGSCSQERTRVIQELQLQLSAQRQQLKVTNEQVNELVEHLSLKQDVAEFAERRAALLEQQLEAARQQLAEALAPAASDAPAHRRSCTSMAESEDEEVDINLEGDYRPVSRQSQHAQQQSPPQQSPQQPCEVQPSKPTGIAGSFTAALSSAASGFNPGAPKGDDHEQPPRQPTPPALSPFALARKFVADREADAMSRLKDELREREQQVASLSMTVKQYELQIDGLQTILSAKVSQCNRVATELKDVSKQLRQSEAAAVSDHAAMTLQIQQLSEEVTELQEDLAEGAQREQQLQAQLAATRAKLAQVLEALVEDAAALQQHKPAQYKQQVQDMPAALADPLASSTTPSKLPASTWTSTDSHAQADSHASTASAGAAIARAASVPLDTLDGDAGGPVRVLSQVSQQNGGMPHGALPGAPAAHADKAFAQGLRSFMRSRTLSSTDGTSGLARSMQAGPSAQGDGWGRCVSANVQVAPQKLRPVSTGLSVGGLAAGNGAGAVSTPTKQSAASKLFEALRKAKKGREQDEAEAAAAAGVSRTTGSGEYSYVLLES